MVLCGCLLSVGYCVFVVGVLLVGSFRVNSVVHYFGYRLFIFICCLLFVVLWVV